MGDVTQLLLDAIPPACGPVGCPRGRPDQVFADCGSDHDIYRDQVRGIVPAIARRSAELGTQCWTVEWNFTWLHGFR